MANENKHALRQNYHLKGSGKYKLLNLFELSLWLDDYDDIFSDFDPRPYTMRVLSDDFINEAKKKSREVKTGAMELVLLIPSKKRKHIHEEDIKKRLNEYFKVQEEKLRRESRELIKRGMFFVVFGAFLMFIASLLFYKYERNIVVSFLIILLEPSSWFLFWEGLSQIVFESKDKKPDLLFFEKMAAGDIIFISY